MADTKPIPIRLSPDMIERLDRAAKTAHLSNRTEVIKLCISSFLDYFEAYGQARLPPNWQEMLADLDGRRNKILTYPSPEDAKKVAESSPEYGISKRKNPS